jgi:hypothetical protein
MPSSQIPHKAHRVLAIIQDYLSSLTTPSYDDLTFELDDCPRTISRCLRYLEQNKMLHIQRRPGHRNQYTLEDGNGSSATPTL